MTITNIGVLSLIFFAQLFTPLAASAAEKQVNEVNAPPSENQYSKSISGLRNKRYCEVLYGKRHLGTLTIKVFNTQGLNECPEALWKALDVKEVEKKNDASFVRLNGPRYWTMDEIKAAGKTANDVIENFGGIEMSLRATLDVGIKRQLAGTQFFVPNVVNRDTAFIYKSGTLIYQLTSPQGQTYIMQSYSQIADPNLSMNDLAQLAARLKLPAGWKYTVKTLTQDLVLQAQGKAYVIQDNFYNSYQRQ